VGGWEPHLGCIGLPTDCTELRSRAKKLAELLQQATRAELNECPATHVKADTEGALHKAAGMAARCFQSHSRFRRFFTFNPVFALPRTLALLDTALAIRRPKTFSRSPRHAEPLLRAAQHAAPPQKSRATLTTLALPHRVQLVRSPPACRRHQPLPGEGGIRVVPEKMESRAE